MIGLVVLFISFFVGVAISEKSGKCSFCVCDTWYGLERASCTSRHLYSIHTGVPNNIQALDMSDNVIMYLNNFELSTVGLTNLKYLNLSENAISEIGLNAFHDLKDLMVLDLSKNRLRYISDDIFEGNENLQVLKLSKNNFNAHVPKLRVPWLMELSLDSCQISHIPLDTFNGLTHVRRLDLSNNLMIQMSNTVLQTLHFLKKLSLEGNPWSCNLVMHNLQVYLKYKNIEFDEFCNTKQKPQKFEKMVVLPTWKSRNYHHSAIANASTGQTIFVKCNLTVSNISNNSNLSMSEQKNQTSIINSLDRYAPYWFLCIGFILGISSGLVISYIWLSTKFLCDRGCRRRRRIDDIFQIVSLLNLYSDSHVDSTGSLIESCPGTPPPPYREVMLRPNLYRCPSIVSNLNNNGTGYRER